MAFSRPPVTAADATFSAAGSAAWAAGFGVAGADVGGITFCPTATTETTSQNLTFSAASGIFIAGSSTPVVSAKGVYINDSRVSFYNTGAGGNDRIGELAWSSNHLRLRFMTDAFDGAVNAIDILGGYSLGLTTITLGTKFVYTESTGEVAATAYKVGATAGASFGPGMPTSMTFVNGILTAAS